MEMGESHENLLKAIKHYQEGLDKYTENRNDAKLLHYLERLYKLPVRVIHLEQTGVGRTVNSLRKLGGDVGDSAKTLVTKWKEMVVGEQEEEEDEEEDDDEEEDGYQTGEDEEEDTDEKEDTSSHRKSDNHRPEAKKDEEKKQKEKHKHHKHNGHSSSTSKHKSHKRRNDGSSSEDESPKKRHKKIESSEDEDRHKQNEEEARKEKKKHKSSDEKTKERHSSSSNSKDKSHKSSSKKEEHKRSSKDKDKKNESSKKESHNKSNKEKSSKPKSSKTTIKPSNTGIDSGSGASFAEALGMCEPSSSSKIKKKVDKKEASVPKLLKEPIPEPEPIDLKLESLLPTITPNYRPLGNLISSDSQPKKSVSDYEALSNIITSKNQRTKVYSGNKMGYGKVPSLFELCIRILQDNIDCLEYTGGVPYNVLKPILEKSNPNQLYALEHHNPYLIEDTDELWRLHCQKEFRNKKREEFESWREMYLRCLDERDAKLKALTANIKQAQDKSLPVRTTKLAYVETVAKPPRNIARKQAKNGTAFDQQRKPAITPAARLATLATSGEAGKVVVPNPGSRAADRTNHSHAVKPKKAPLMLKSISSFKNRFKR